MRKLTVSYLNILFQILLSSATIAGNLKGRVYSKADKVVVAIKDVKGSFPLPDTLAVLDQRNMRFIPSLLPIRVGTIVDFPNNEEVIYHHVCSISPAKIFDLGTYRSGEKRSIMFDKPGILEVFCALHTRMYAVLAVFDNPYFSICDENGRFEIEDIPAGNYTINVILVYTRKQEYVSEYRNISIPSTGTTTLNIRR